MFVSVCPHDDLKVIADICFLLGGSKTRNHVLGAPHTSVKIRRVEKKILEEFTCQDHKVIFRRVRHVYNNRIWSEKLR